MANYRRAWTPAGTFFFTVALAERHSSLLVDEIASLRRAFASAKKARPFDIDAVVILPDHMHCIWTLPAGDIDFATRWAHIKSGFCRHLPKTELRSASRSRKRERGVWQRRYWEHRIRDEADYAAHFDYVHINPVKHGHVFRTAEWPWSSFHNYLRLGVLALDWGDAVSSRCASEKSEPVG